MVLCVESKKVPLHRTIDIFDTVAATLFQATVILSDSLLVSFHSSQVQSERNNMLS
jgi:hypothetical protein